MKAVPLFKTACRWISGLMVLPVFAAQAATVPLFVNNGTLNYGNNPPPPSIDAAAVFNRGVIDSGFASTLLFETFNTRFFTNDFSGVMQGSPGFRFDLNTNGNRGASESFVNRGRINAGSQIRVNSKRIVNGNGALLQSGPAGLVKLEGGTVNLSRGGVSAGGGAQQQSGGFRFANGNFVNGSGIVDLHWGADDNNTLANGGPMMPLTGQFDINAPFFGVASPFHQVLTATSTFTNTVIVPRFGPFIPYTAHVLSNSISATQQFIQVVFVPVDTDTNIVATSVRFFPGGPASTAVIGFESPAIDVITGDPYTNAVYVLDTTAVNGTNAVITTNVGVFPRTFRPLAFEVTQATPFQWTFGSPTNAVYDNDLLDNPLYSTLAVDVAYSGYSAQVNTAFQITGTGSQNPSNAPGRVEISGSEVNLDQARIAAQNFISIRGSNVLGTGRYFIDAPFINMDLRSTNEVLVLDTVGPTSVRRVSGQVSMWSGYWTNAINENGLLIEREFAVTVVHPELAFTTPIQFGEFQVTANQVILGDQLNLPEDAVFNAKCLTIGSNALLNFAGNVGVAQMPMLMCFTNHGTINAFNFATFGPDQAAPLTDFVNTGFITAGTLSIDTGTFTSAGDPLTGLGGSLQSSVGPLMARFNTGMVTDSQFTALGAVGSVEFTGTDLLIRNTGIRADSALVFNVTGTLDDGGTASGNIWTVRRGFEFLAQPAMGGLLGTTITSAPANFVATEHVFCGANLGVTNAGFTNNAAIGVLSLRGALFNTFVFRGNAPGKALYVDFLDLQGSATNFLDTIEIDPDAVVYFADSNLPAEKLDGAFNGRLRWISTYAGAFSSITIPLSGGGTITVNRGLRNSSAIDSDADGIPNAFDPFPFDPPFVQVNIVQIASLSGGAPQNVAQVSWQAAANTMYRVECRTSLTAQWQFLTNYTHGSKNGLATITDPINEAGICFYRVVYFK